MYANSILAISGLLSLVAAVPMAHEHHHKHQQRDYVWVTETEEAIVTVPVTQTVWLEPGETAPSDHQQNRPVFTSRIQQTVTVPYSSPAASSSSTEAPSPYVPPTSSSTSQYVAPTTSEYTPPPAPTTSSSSSVYVPPPAPTTSSTSQYVPPPAPTTSSTSQYVPPPAPTTSVAPTSTYAPPAYSAPASSSSGASSATTATPITPDFIGSGATSGMGAPGKSYSGDMTYYAVEAGLGACGQQWAATDAVVAISHVIFDSYSTGNPNTNPLCGQKVSIIGSDGQEHKATITDKCPGCAEADLDLSTAMFAEVVPNGDGRVHNVKWSFA